MYPVSYLVSKWRAEERLDEDIEAAREQPGRAAAAVDAAAVDAAASAVDAPEVDAAAVHAAVVDAAVVDAAAVDAAAVDAAAVDAQEVDAAAVTVLQSGGQQERRQAWRRLCVSRARLQLE